MTRFGLITRLALLVIGVEVAAFGSLGWFYTNQSALQNTSKPHE